jgi:hypothetical protein
VLQIGVAGNIDEERLAWLGHVERMDKERMSRKHGKMDERRRRGRPRKR